MSNMVVNTNVRAINSHRNLKKTGLEQGKSSSKLSSGLRINSAADDAAGLAISEKMRGQIRGLDQASRNAQDGISMVQTAEGGMQEVTNMVQRIRELVVQSSNDTNTEEDRSKIQGEVTQLLTEIDAMSERVEFNTKPLINGEYDGTARAAEAAIPAVPAGTKTYKEAGVDLTPDVSVGGIDLFLVKDTAAADAKVSGAQVYQDADGKAYNATGGMLDVDGAVTLVVGDQVAVGAIDPTKLDGGVAAVNRTIATTVSKGSPAVAAKDARPAQSLSLQIGANKEQLLTFNIGSVTTKDLGIKDINVENIGSGEITKLLETMDEGLGKVANARAELGAVQNRLEYTINSLDISSENLSASESRIRDTDMAKEMMKLTKTNVLQQAATSMLAQANQAPQNVLQLLQ